MNYERRRIVETIHGNSPFPVVIFQFERRNRRRRRKKKNKKWFLEQSMEQKLENEIGWLAGSTLPCLPFLPCLPDLLLIAPPNFCSKLRTECARRRGEKVNVLTLPCPIALLCLKIFRIQCIHIFLRAGIFLVLVSKAIFANWGWISRVKQTVCFLN